MIHGDPSVGVEAGFGEIVEALDVGGLIAGAPDDHPCAGSPPSIPRRQAATLLRRDPTTVAPFYSFRSLHNSHVVRVASFFELLRLWR